MQVTGYEHFSDKAGGCPLYDNTEARHHDDVKKAEKAALEKIRAEHPELTEDELKISVSDEVNRAEQKRLDTAKGRQIPAAPRRRNPNPLIPPQAIVPPNFRGAVLRPPHVDNMFGNQPFPAAFPLGQARGHAPHPPGLPHENFPLGQARGYVPHPLGLPHDDPFLLPHDVGLEHARLGLQLPVFHPFQQPLNAPPWQPHTRVQPPNPPETQPRRPIMQPLPGAAAPRNDRPGDRVDPDAVFEEFFANLGRPPPRRMPPNIPRDPRNPFG